MFMTLLDLPPNAESLLPPKTPPKPESSSLWIETRKIRNRLTRTKRTKRMILKTAIYYLPIKSAIDDRQELLKSKRCSANQCAVDVFASHKLLDIRRLH